MDFAASWACEDMALTSLFRDALHEAFGTWPIAYIPYGGADFGEIRAVAQAIGDGDDAAYYHAWNAAADRLSAEADAAFVKGHVVSARALYLSASAFYGTSFHPLHGAPVDPRLLAAFRKEVAAFDKGLALGPQPAAPLTIPFEQTPLPAYFIPAEGFETQVRPLIIFNNGYDCTITDTYFASAVAASQRGYHSLLFDGPGQGPCCMSATFRCGRIGKRSSRRWSTSPKRYPWSTRGALRFRAGAWAATLPRAVRPANRASPH